MNSADMQQLYVQQQFRSQKGELVRIDAYLTPGSESIHRPCPKLQWTQCTDYWWAFRNAAINLWVSKHLLTY